MSTSRPPTSQPPTSQPPTSQPPTSQPTSNGPIVFPSKTPNLTNFNNYIQQLKNKKKAIEDALKIQNRWNMFNDTYNKRYIQYIKIICIIIFGIICIWLTKVVNDYNILSEFLFNSIIICIISITIIFIYLIYKDVLIHNIMKYDEIDYQSPSNDYTSKTTPSLTKTDTIKCNSCPTGYKYNVDTGYCYLDNSLYLTYDSGKIVSN